MGGAAFGRVALAKGGKVVAYGEPLLDAPSSCLGLLLGG